MKRNALISNKGFLFLILITLFLGFMNEGFGQSIWTNPITGKDPDPSFYNPYTNDEVFDVNITVSGIGRGAGINENIANNRYNAKGWGLTALDGTDYFTFTLRPNTGFQINFLSFIYTGQRSDINGPTSFALRSSVDGFTANIGMPTAVGTTIDLNNLIFKNISTAIEFRFYAWDAAGINGTFSINDFTFNGIISKSTIDFDGIDDYVDFGDKHGFAGSFSLEAWVLQKAIVASATIISKGDVKTSNKRGFHLALNSGKINLTCYNISGLPILNITSPYAIATDKWHHIAATYDGATAKLYVDGLEVKNGSPSGPISNGTEKFLIGAMYDSGTPTVPKNYFKGYIDEVRIWNTALTTQQIREMMNQEIEINGIAVKGKAILLNISGGLLWETLMGYYPMNDDTANDKSGNALKIVGSPKNMTTSQLQTAPLPYVSCANGSWDKNATWLNGTVQNTPNTVGIDGLTSIDWNIVETKHDITSGLRDITLLGLLSKSGKLTMDGSTGADGTGTGQGLWITHYLKLDGVIDLEGESQLVQKRYGSYDADDNFITTQFSESIFEENSSGYIERDQQGKQNSYNYNYWSSPVTRQGSANNAPYTVPNVLRDGTNPATPKNISFVDGAYSADGALTSPIKITSRWIWTYRATVNGNVWDNYYQWFNVGYWGNIKVGDGFTMKGTGGAAAIDALQNYVFVGKPNSGDIPTTLLNPGQLYLIGNPYPSALDADEFIKDNIKETINGKVGRNTVNVFNGALYFWDHFGLSNNHLLAGYEAGYATYNLMGGVIGIANVPLTANTLQNGSKKPERYIPVGQGFFVEATLPSPLGTIDGGNLNFKNSQRVFKREGFTGTNNGSLFMKTAASKKSKTQETDTDTRAKIRLTFDSPLGYRRSLLVGVDENASNKFDIGYDAPLNEDNKEDMYWIFSGSKFVIQGVNNFDKDQELPLGLKISKAGLASIKIDATENMGKKVSLYIKDNLTGLTFDINSNPFEINLASGTYENRFSLVFKAKKIKDKKDNKNEGNQSDQQFNNQPDDNLFVINTEILVRMNNPISALQIKNSSTTKILSIGLYNYLGQSIKTWNTNLNKSEITLPINIATGVYVVQINTINGQVAKKIVVE